MSHADTLRALREYVRTSSRGTKVQRDTIAAIDAELAECEPAKYEPRVGDIVINLYQGDDLARIDKVEGRYGMSSRWESNHWVPSAPFVFTNDMRPATPAELAAAGIAPPPAPKPASPDKATTEARPTIIRSLENVPPNGLCLMAGAKYRVVKWLGANPVVMDDEDDEMMVVTKWEAAPEPATAPESRFRVGQRVRIVAYKPSLRDFASSFKKSLPIGTVTTITDVGDGDQYVTVTGGWTPHVDEIAPAPGVEGDEAKVIAARIFDVTVKESLDRQAWLMSSEAWRARFIELAAAEIARAKSRAS